MEKNYEISGMTCDHCVMHVKNALEGVDGVESAAVDLKKGSARVVFSGDVGIDALKAAVDEAGYALVSETA